MTVLAISQVLATDYFQFAGSIGRHSPARCPCMINSSAPSIATFSAFVQLKDYRQPAEKAYVPRRGDQYHGDPATLFGDQIGAYFADHEAEAMLASALEEIPGGLLLNMCVKPT